MGGKGVSGEMIDFTSLRRPFDDIFLHPSLPDFQENMIVQEAIGTRLFDGESILFFREMSFISRKSAFDVFLQTLH